MDELLNDRPAWGGTGIDGAPADEWRMPKTRSSAFAWTRSHPRLASVAIAAVTCAVALTAAAVSVQPRHHASGPVPPNQAGYLWCCGAKNVAAQWVVPAIVHPSSVAAEAVWIGAQTNSGKFFLQVGSQEFVSSTAQYQAFWSDGPLDGAPQNMGDLHPGDVVRARMIESSNGWKVVFADRTQHWSHAVKVPRLASSVGALAEWIEEDPVDVDPVRGSILFHMAETEGTRVRHLVVNGAAPQPNLTEPESFIDASHRTFAPSALVDNSFTFSPW